MTLSDDQFKGLVHEVNQPEGGFSVRAFGPRTGERASNSFMVGTVGHGQDVPHPTDTATMRSYTKSRQGPLERSNAFLGGWHGPGAVSLDVSESYPRTKRGEVHARHATLAAHQMAYGEVGHSGEYVGDRPNPFHGQPGASEGIKRSWKWAPVRSRRPASPQR